MKRWIFSTCFFLFITASFAGKFESLPVDYYYIVSDIENDSVPKGKCLVKGIVTEGYSGLPIQGGLIANFDRSAHAITNEKGEYELFLSAKDTGLFFFKQNYKEIVCWSYKFQSKHVVTMNFVSSEKLPDGMMIIEEKPVVYLYSEVDKNVTVKLDDRINLTTTYPLYEGGWNVGVSASGDINLNNRSYPYLFWEGETSEMSFQVKADGLEGYLIKTDSTIAFLEGVLASAGLNQKEATDFITYWAPRIEKKPYSFIQFWVDEEYGEQIGKIFLDPEPDIQRRVYMVFSGFEKKPTVTNLSQPNWEPIQREGLVLIEWGGSELTASPTGL